VGAPRRFLVHGSKLVDEKLSILREALESLWLKVPKPIVGAPTWIRGIINFSIPWEKNLVSLSP
jgi:hypothetical protein